MSKTPVSGRHRAAGRHNPLTELTGMVARAGESGVKASAVLAASGFHFVQLTIAEVKEEFARVGLPVRRTRETIPPAAGQRARISR